MSTTPEALRLADEFSLGSYGNGTALLAAAELRRLHSVNAALVEALCDMERATQDKFGDMVFMAQASQKCRAALAAAKEK